MDPLKQIHRALTLEESSATCELDHGSFNHKNWDYKEADKCPSVATFTLPVGNNDYTYAICKDCAETLNNHDPDWLLFICLGCSSTKWKLRKAMKKSFGGDVIQPINYCVNCLLGAGYDENKRCNQEFFNF